MNLSSKRWGRREAALGPQSSSNIAEGIKCLIPGCSRLAEKSEGRGLAQYYCRYHIQLKSRHGSYWHATYRASDLRPYIRCAERWIKEHGDSPIYRGAYWQLERKREFLHTFWRRGALMHEVSTKNRVDT